MPISGPKPPLDVKRPAPKVPEAARSDEAADKFREGLLERTEAELELQKAVAGTGTSQQVAAYARKKLITQLLAGRDDKAAQDLKTKFPTLAAEIQQAQAELATWRSPLDVRATNTAAVADALVWPAANAIASTLTTQAQSGNADYRRRVALDLIARMRLQKNDSYAGIESTIPNLLLPARMLAARVTKEEYPLFRLQLLSLPLADTGRVYYIRNLAIQIQGLMTANKEGATIRGAVHNSAGPSNVPLVGKYVSAYFKPNASGERPEPHLIAALMGARRSLKSGDLEAARKSAPMLKAAFAGYEPGIGSALAALSGSDGAAALAEIEKFIHAHLFATASTVTIDPEAMFPTNTGAPLPDAALQAIRDTAAAIEKNDPATTADRAAAANLALTQAGYPVAFSNVASYATHWKAGNAAYAQHVRNALTQFLQSARMFGPAEARATLKGTLSTDAIERTAKFLSALQAGQLDTVYASYPQLVQDFAGTVAHAKLASYQAYFTPAHKASYNAYTLSTWVNQALRQLVPATLAQQPLAAGASDGVSYAPIDVFDKLTELYGEIATLYNQSADVAMLERSFPLWAPKEIQNGLFRATAYLRASDRLSAAAEIADLRTRIKEAVLPNATPRTEQLLGVLESSLGDLSAELAPVATAVRNGAANAKALLEVFVSSHAAAGAMGRSAITVTAIKPAPSKPPVTPEGLAVLNQFMAAMHAGLAAEASALVPALTAHFQSHTNFTNYVTQYTVKQLATTPPQLGQAMYYFDHFLIANGAERQLSPGGMATVPALKPDKNGAVPNAAVVALVQNVIDKARANDQPGTKVAFQQAAAHLQHYPNYQLLLAHVGNLTGYAPAFQVLPYLESFLLENRSVSDEEIRSSFKLPTGKKAPAKAADALIELRRLLNSGGPGQENLRLMQLDGLLEDISTGLLGAIGEELGEIEDHEIGAALVALKAGLGSALAGGMPDVKGGAAGAGTRQLELLATRTSQKKVAERPSLSALSAKLDALLTKSKLGENEIRELRDVAEQISEGVWQTYVDLKGAFGPRLDRIAKQYALQDPAFVDNLIKQGPLGHLKALADSVAAWGAAKLGGTSAAKTELGAVLENPKGVRVMSEGRAVLKRVVIAESLKDIPKKVVPDENTLLVLGTVGNENISMAGSVLVNRATTDGAGAGGQFSHIFVWTRNAGIAGAAFENATEEVADFQKKFAAKIAAGEEIYLEATKGGLRLAPVSEAIARGWMTAAETPKLRPGLNTFVRFMVPDGAGGQKPDPESIRLSKKKANKPLLEIDIAYPMAALNGVGDNQLSFANLATVGTGGVHADALVGPKAAVLARMRQMLSGWANVVLPGQAIPFGQVQRVLEQAGVLEAIAALEPSLAADSESFWSSAFMTDPAHRSKQCAAIQDVYKKKLAALLLEPDPAGGLRPTAVARKEILDPLKTNPELVGPDGKLKPLILRSSANTEDSADFNAAGKHKTVANVLTEAGVVQAFIDVAASLWNVEAVETRRLFGVDSRLAAMSVLCQPVVQPEISGVLVTRNDHGGDTTAFAYQATRGLFGGVHGDAQIQVSELGAAAAQRKVLVPYQAAKMAVLDTVNGGVKEQAVEVATTPGASLLTPAQEQALYQYSTQIKQFFNQHVYPGKNLDMDIEFMVVGGQLKITQARPLPRPLGS